MRLVRFLVLVVIKLISGLCFRFSVDWVDKESSFRNIRLILLLNHTNLFEPVFTAVLPYHLLWQIASRGILPGADITLNRVFAGGLYRLLAPRAVTISRQRDETWESFLTLIRNDSLVLMAPEGRMKRPTGLDKNGNPMTVRGGVVDILKLISDGKMLLAYSHGLHHIHAPGQRFPKLFRRAGITFESIDIAEYKDRFCSDNDREFRRAIICDLEKRRDQHCRVS